MSDRPLFLHEYVDIVGEGTHAYMEHTVEFDCERAGGRGLRLLGTWETVGSTGRWPQVVNVWELIDGWDGWARLTAETNLRRRDNEALEQWWRTALRSRSGGYDRVLGGVAGTPTLDALVAGGVSGSLFMHEVSEVRPGTARDYLRAVHEDLVPLMAEFGHTLVGLYEVLMTDSEVCVIWAADLDAHIDLMRARDGGTARIDIWEATARRWRVRIHEELLVPQPGTVLYAPHGH